MRRSTKIVLLLAILCAFGSALTLAVNGPSRDAKPVPAIRPNEQLVYEGEFSRALLRGVTVAEMTFSVNSFDRQPGSPVIFKGEAVSKGMLSKLFGFSFRELIESKVEPQSFTLLGNTKLDEQGSRRRSSETVHDSENQKVIWTERDLTAPDRAPRVVSTDKVPGGVQDLISAIYYLRTQPLKTGDNLTIDISDSGQLHSVPVAVREKKKLKTVLGKVNCIRVEPLVFGENGMIAGKGSFSLWLTDDNRHIPVKAHVETRLGTLEITLKKAS